MKKIIAHVAGGLTTGGVEAVLYNYFSNMNLEEYELHYIAYDTPNPVEQEKFEKLGFKVHVVTKKKDNLIKSFREAYSVIKENHINIIHSHMTLMCFVTSFLGMLCGVKVRIAHSHLAQHPTGIKKVIYAFFKLFTRITSTHYYACGEEAGKYLFGKRNMKKGKVRIINNAIDTDKNSYSEEIRKKKREQLQLGEKTCIGNVGRFTEQKNQSFLIDVFREVHKQNENTILVLVGEGPLLDDVKKKVKEYDLLGAVLFLGARSDVNELYQAMDVFALPSLYEGLALVLVEAQCADLPILTSDTVTKEIEITNNMKYLPLNDTQVWTKELLELCANTTKTRKDVSEVVREFGYDIKKESEELDLLYNEQLKERG